jgi:hypothetical protein
MAPTHDVSATCPSASIHWYGPAKKRCASVGQQRWQRRTARRSQTVATAHALSRHDSDALVASLQQAWDS